MANDQYLNKLFVERELFEDFDEIKFQHFIEEILICPLKCQDNNVWKLAIKEICGFYLDSKKFGWKYYLERLTYVSLFFLLLT